MKIKEEQTAPADMAGMREAVDYWNERLTKYREKAGADAKPDAVAYVNHPGHSQLSAMYRVAFFTASDEDAERWSCDLLAKIGHDADGNILVDGKGRDHVRQMIQWADVAADRAAWQGRIAECGYAAAMADLWRAIEIVCWVMDPKDDPLTHALREAIV